MKDWGSLDDPYQGSLNTARLRPMAVNAACSQRFLRENISLSIEERAQLLNSIEPLTNIKRHHIASAYRKKGIRKKKIRI